MRKNYLITMASALAMTASVAVVPHAKADTVIPGAAGHGWPATTTCFDHGWSAMKNNCGFPTFATLVIPIARTHTGNTRFRVRADGAEPGPLSIGIGTACRAIVATL